jgi:transposase
MVGSPSYCSDPLPAPLVATDRRASHSILTRRGHLLGPVPCGPTRRQSARESPTSGLAGAAQAPDQDAARRFKGARWALLKNPGDLTDDQASTLPKLKRRGGDLWRAYALKEALRAIFAGDLSEDEVAMMPDRFCSKASRSGLKPFVTLAKTIRKRKAGILAAVRFGINNARHEGLNRRVRLIINRAYGFHSANAALALIMVTLGPIEHVLPHERVRAADP